MCSNKCLAYLVLYFLGVYLFKDKKLHLEMSSTEKYFVAITRKIFRQINYLVTYLLKTILSRNFLPKMRDRDFP